MSTRSSLALAAVSLLTACGADGVPTETQPLSPLPPEGGQQLASDSVRLEPGDERYMCYQFYSPDDAVGITRVDALSVPGVHHVGLFQAFGRDESPEPHECDTLIKQTWLPIWASGAGSPTLQLPAGTGFIIQPGTQYIIQLHLQNATERAMNIRAGVNLTYERAVASLQPAGMYAFGTFNMEIPANTLDYQVPIAHCAPGKQMNVFAAFPHMHKYGRKLSVTRSIAGGSPAPFYEIDPWTFGNQPMDPLETTVSPTDELNVTCHYDNRTADAVPYGESSEQEMCFFVLFYYPYDSLGGCVLGS